MINKKFVILIVVLITIIAFFLRVLPFNYGLAPIYFNDIASFSKSFEMANGIAHHDFSQFKKPGPYPYFSSYIFLFVFGIFYLIGIIGGFFSSTYEFLKYAILEMDKFFEMSRIITAILGALLIPLVYLVTRQIISMAKKKWVESGAILSALLMCFSLIHVHYSHIVRPHMIVAFFLFLSFYAYLFLLKKQNFVSYILLGATAGFAAGTLHNGFLAILFLVAAHFFIRSQQNNKKIFSFPFIAALIIFFLIVFVCWPYLILNLGETLDLKTGKVNIILSGEITPGGVFNGAGFIIDLKGLFFSETGLIIMLIFLSIVYLVYLKRGKREKDSIKNPYYRVVVSGGLFILIIHFLIFGTYSVHSYKFLVPIIPFLCVFVGILFSRNLELISKKYYIWLIGFIGIIVIFSAIQALRLTTIITRKDTRELTIEWIEKNIDSSKMIAVSSSGPKFFPNKESLEKKLLLAGSDSLGQRDKFLLSLDAKKYPQNSRSIFPLWAFDENPEKIYDFLRNQADYFVFVRYNLYPELDPTKLPEQEMANELGEIIKTFSPASKPSNRNSYFPANIFNPLIDLWVFDKMGPFIEIYKINK